MCLGVQIKWGDSAGRIDHNDQPCFFLRSGLLFKKKHTCRLDRDLNDSSQSNECQYIVVDLRCIVVPEWISSFDRG